MKTHYDRSLFISSLTGVIVAVGISGCAPQKSTPSPLANKALVSNTEIYMGSDRYGIEAAPASAASEQEAEATPESTAPAEKKRSSKRKSNASSEGRSDVDFVLTMSKAIDVGVASSVASAQTQNSEKSFVPASITKVFTTAIALKELGADFRFRTRVAFNLGSSGQASHVVVAADGDPTGGVTAFEAGAPDRMRDIAQALKARGVREITGTVTFVSSDPRLDTPAFAAGIPQTDMRECYGALTTAFNHKQNCVLAKIDPRGGFTWENNDAGNFVETKIEAQAGSKSSLQLETVLSADRGLRGYVLSGTYNSAKPKILQMRLPVANAATWYASSLLQSLRENQIGTSNASVSVARTSQERAVAMSTLAQGENHAVSIESAPLSKIVLATNKPSDNFFADALFKAIGSRLGPKVPSISAASRTKIKETLDAWLREDGHGSWSNELHFLEGAGLSSENRATPRAFLAALRRIALEPTFPQFLESLPIAGVDGTLADRMKNTIAAGQVRAKTGTLKGSYQLVGFLPHRRGAQTDYIPFVILTSTTENNRGVVRQFQDALVVKMMESLKTE